MLFLTGLRVAMLSEPCRMCAMRMVGEASLTPSIAFEGSQFHINMDKPADREEGEEEEEEGAKASRRRRVADYEVQVF